MSVSADMGPAGIGWADRSQEDSHLWDVLQELVNDRGRVGAANELGVNYRTVAANLKAGSLSRRMRKAVQGFEGSEAELEPAESPEWDESRRSDDQAEAVAQRMETLVAAVRQLRETVETQAGQLDELGRRVAGLEEATKERAVGNVGPAVGEGERGKWRPPRRAPELPARGVVTLEPQPDEVHAFGPAAGLVAEWRELRDGHYGSSVDRARARECWWDLGILLIEEYHLTLPPRTKPLQASTRDDHLRRHREALAGARKERVTAERWEGLRMVLTFGLWRGRPVVTACVASAKPAHRGITRRRRIAETTAHGGFAPNAR